MPHRLRCVCCGKVVRLFSANAGQRMMCPACGMPNEAPAVIPIYTTEFIESARRHCSAPQRADGRGRGNRMGQA